MRDDPSGEQQGDDLDRARGRIWELFLRRQLTDDQATVELLRLSRAEPPSGDDGAGDRREVA